MRFDWVKEAISGATYARALSNAAGRAGRDVGAMQPALANIAAQPQASLRPGLSQFMREPGKLPMTPQRQQMRDLSHALPWQGDEHGGTPNALHGANRMLEQRGLSTSTPGGPEAFQRQVLQNLPARGGSRTDTQVGYRSGAPKPFDYHGQVEMLDRHLDALHGEKQQWPSQSPKKPAPLAAPGPAVTYDQTHVGRAPGAAPAPSSPVRSMLRQPPAAYANTQTANTGATSVLKPQPQPAAYANTQAVNTGATSVLKPQPASLGATRVLRKQANAGAIAAGIGIPLALGGGMLLNKPGIQSNIKNLAGGNGSTQDQDTAGDLHPAAIGHAEKIHQALLARGLDPSTIRMGIDAPPGSGKTTLARAVAQRSGMKHHGLDWEPGNWWKSTVGLGRNVESMPRAPKAGEILEHYMLGRTYDPEVFDAMVHIRRDPELLKQQLTARGNGAYIGDMMDLHKSLGVAAKGFDTLGGDMIDIGDGVQLKMRPREGWGNNLDQQLMQAGMNPEGMSRHEKLLSLHEGKKTTGAGWTPYVKNPFSTGESLALAGSVPLGIMAARALMRRPPVG